MEKSVSTRELIDAIIDGDAIQIDNTFNMAMAEKISTNLDSMRERVAQSMFNPSVEQATE